MARLVTATEIELEQARLELDRQRLELQRLRLEDARERRQRADRLKGRSKLLKAHLGSVITAIVSLAAILVSLTQVWIATSAKQNELHLLKMQQAQEWKFKALEFVTRNADSFFGRDRQRREHMASALAVAFPPDVAGPLLDNLKQASPSDEARKTFTDTMDRMHAKPK